jgi:hypothetical protein
MLVSLPMLAFLALFLIFRKSADDWRCAALSAAVGWGTLVALATEALSLLAKLEFLWVLGFWSLVNVVLFTAYFKYFSALPSSQLRESDNKLGLPFLVSLCGLALAALATLLIAVSAPPNNWDSMTYHMSRVVHWIQNSSVNHYPTSIDRQLWLNPWAEFAITHFQILSGGDRFANMVQWLCMVGSLLGVSLVAKQLGANSSQQVVAGVFAGTLPMGILQATSTQTDYVVAFWLICFIHFGLRLILLKSWDKALPDSTLTGLSLGFAVATKGTAYVFALPFALWIGFVTFKAKAWKPLALILAIALSINLGHYARNLDLYGNALGPPPVPNLTNESHSLAAGISNVLRNTALHLSTPVKSVNRHIEKGLGRFHGLVGIDISDPRTSFSDFLIPTLAFNEDTSGNPIHFFLIVVSLAGVALSKLGSRLIGYYAISAVVSFLLFCVLLKWQPFNSRLHLPFFVLMSPLVAVMLMKIFGEKAAYAVCGLLLVCALPWLLLNQSRPVLASDLLPKKLEFALMFDNPKLSKAYETSVFTQSRPGQMFKNRPELQRHYEAATAFVKSRGYRNIGISIGGDDWEYPFWDLLNRDEAHPVRIEHFEVKDVSKRKATNFQDCDLPDCIISLVPSSEDRITMNNGSFLKRWNSGPVTIFVRETGH